MTIVVVREAPAGVSVVVDVDVVVPLAVAAELAVVTFTGVGADAVETLDVVSGVAAVAGGAVTVAGAGAVGEVVWAAAVSEPKSSAAMRSVRMIAGKLSSAAPGVKTRAQTTAA